MEMNVKDGFGGIAVCIEHGAISAIGKAALFRKRGGAPCHLANDRIVLRHEIVQRRDMCLRDDEGMQRPLRIDVLESQEPIVLVENFGGNLTLDDPAEQAIAHSAFLMIAAR